MKALVTGIIVALGLSTGVATAQTAAKASFINVEGKKVGTATLTQTPGGVLIHLEVEGLAPGEHAFHVHQTGKCDAADKFASAGGHFEPAGHKHGYKTDGGPHAGDMPNQFVGADGKLTADVVNPQVTLAAGATSVFDADGSALVIHAKADDYASQPAGNAGDRAACAVIEK